MKVALVQTEHPSEIIGYVNNAIREGVDLICFPEMSLCGYSFERISEREFEQRDLLTRLLVLAKENHITISAGGIEKDDNSNFYITQFVISSKIEGYRKTHLGTKEKLYFKQGDEIPLFDCKGITFGIMTCYDAHFPELATQMTLKGAKFILNPTAVPHDPEKRVTLWSKYLTARAYDNRVWVLANNLCFNSSGGGLAIYNSDGDLIDSCSHSKSSIIITNLELKEYSSTSMKNRDFNADRREGLYVNR